MTRLLYSMLFKNSTKFPENCFIHFMGYWNYNNEILQYRHIFTCI